MTDPPVGWDLPDHQVAEIRDFLRDCAETAAGTVDAARPEAVLTEFARTSGYRHTEDELVTGCKIAWRNSVHCVGKANWRVLDVRDARQATEPDDIYEACVEHLRRATNGGRIRATITVLGAQPPDGPGPRIWNSQLVRYAGYRQPDGTVVGDPETVAFTEWARSLGWPGGAGGPFDILPLVISAGTAPPRWYPLPADAVLEVPLSHPTLPWFADLGLRWYAHPAISDQKLRMGGLTYPAVPFSGWYTSTEIGARNLSDSNRYDMLPVIADRMGLDRRSSRTLWQDRAMLELLTAVMHSFELHGVTIVDHHFVAEAFVRHERREQAAGRTVDACWRSLVAPTGASTTATFSRRYPETVRLPNFFPHEPREAGGANGPGCPVTGHGG
ncbi:nitric oxide synthase oxygenase [Micromonospora sp. NPDC049048]|uniref:nitric oxide synthase oxygenase n=1 Tax=Micromonospora sp. NPDC049048 TaxID=3364263 RepID=UPI003720715D